MAVEVECPPRNAQLIGKTFVERYYHNINQLSILGDKFYRDCSVVSRPGPKGEMSDVTTIKDINDAIQSFGSKNLKAEIYNTYAQFSDNKGVIVVVTGCVTGADNGKRNFTQSFFLAPQDNDYFALNDVFRYFDEKNSAEHGIALANGANKNIPAEEVIPKTHSNSRQNSDVSSVTESASSDVQADLPKKSYASMVMIAKENITVAAPVNSKSNGVKIEPVKITKKLNGSAAPEAAPIHSYNGSANINNRRPLPEGSNGKDKNPARRQGFRNDQKRDRGNYTGNRFNDRNDVRKPVVSAPAKVPVEIDEDGFQKVVRHNSGGRVAR